MFSNISILIAAKDFNSHKKLIEHFKSCGGTVNICNAECIKVEIEVLKHEPDILILQTDDIPFSDLERLIKNISLLNKSPSVFTLSSYEDSYANQKLISLGVVKCITYPYILTELADTIYNYIKSAPVDTDVILAETNKNINNFLMLMGFHSGMQGFGFLRKAILTFVLNRNKKINFSKNLYPEIAEYFNTTPQCVEWGIRSAISKAWSKADSGIKVLFFDTEKLKNHSKPTNLEFITTAGNYILLECRELIEKINNSDNTIPPLHKV
ncbi:MAG: sporulation initiation factor Spo0A C-terminal domain-containing protein [Oscillospiraceae bacterium]